MTCNCRHREDGDLIAEEREDLTEDGALMELEISESQKLVLLNADAFVYVSRGTMRAQ